MPALFAFPFTWGHLAAFLFGMFALLVLSLISGGNQHPPEDPPEP